MFADPDLRAMDEAASGRLAGKCLACPLARTGERFPFRCDAARGFFPPEPDDPLQRYTASLVGMAFVERLAYDVLDRADEYDRLFERFRDELKRRGDLWASTSRATSVVTPQTS